MSKANHKFASTGIVVIGRNEGARLVTGLDSIVASFKNHENIVYVDSGSTDDSLQEAVQRGIATIELDTARPLSAARARNAGYAWLSKKMPGLEYLQFIDGDCELHADWLAKAFQFLEDHSSAAAVCGRITERNPHASIYNFICQQEWDTPTGKTRACGGNSMMRASVFSSEAGFRDDLIAGEEPELCFRFREAGWEIWKLPEDMVIHDANMTRFSEWWKRSVRGGHAFAQGRSIHGAKPEQFNVRESWRILFWGLGLPLLIFCFAAIVGYLGLLLLVIYPAQILRLTLKMGGLSRDNFITAFFLVLRKFPESIGQLKFFFANISKARAQLIEYK